ncbi:M10 family metallopeptidase C-terminal domain-containing protein [Neisseria wadsworthii]|uniref:M10 family metallopeptidase C-terminal domain-containing protein n=1 Tax=Neisseria wadsworthii TaxID=607711 RepID=UPI000D31FAF4|nr:M10 family metallopeptidase C-terminal domain-containing protein [Neisseria wadsworthii]
MRENQTILAAGNQAANVAGDRFTDGDEAVKATSNKLVGYVLDNASNAESAVVESYSINGMTYKAGETASIFGIGTFKLNANGIYDFSVEGQRVQKIQMPVVRYTVKNGDQTDESELAITLDKQIVSQAYPEANAKANVAVDLNTTGLLSNGEASGNVLHNYEGSDKPYIAGFLVGNAYYASGQTVKVDNFGEVTVNRDGSYTIKADDLKAGAKVPVIAFTVSNGYAASSSSLVLRVPSDNESVLTDGDELYGDVSGNVLENASSTLGGKPFGDLGVTSFKEGGMNYKPGDKIQFDGGTLQLKANGDYEFASNGAYTVYETPDVTYTVSNGKQTDKSTLKVSYDWGHMEGEFGRFVEDKGKVLAGDNRVSGSAKLLGGVDDSDLLLGDAFNVAAAGSDTIIAGTRAASSSSDILVGDRLNIDHLSWKSGDGTTVQGSSYDNAVAGIRDYLRANGISSSDEEVIRYVRENYKDLVDTNPQGGDDKLVGSHNNDILIGGAGNDTLTGNAGKDVFVFAANSNSGKDVITDFTRGYDKIVFTDLNDPSKLNWNASTGVLSFTGVKDGQTYQNSITIQNASADLKVEDLVANAAIV